MGQKRKGSDRANVFRFVPQSRHKPLIRTRPSSRSAPRWMWPRDHRNISLRSIAGCFRFLTLIRSLQRAPAACVIAPDARDCGRQILSQSFFLIFSKWSFRGQTC
jgi:hypothetical protein